MESLVSTLNSIYASVHLADIDTDWLEGTLLLALYIIIAVACWFYPKAVGENGASACPGE